MAIDQKTIYVYAGWSSRAPALIVSTNWRALAADYGLSRGAIERMEPAFVMEYK